MQKYSEGLAAGYAELGYGAGDVMATWLPADCAEALICKFAAARLGMTVVEIDMAEADPEAVKSALKNAKAKVTRRVSAPPGLALLLSHGRPGCMAP